MCSPGDRLQPDNVHARLPHVGAQLLGALERLDEVLARVGDEDGSGYPCELGVRERRAAGERVDGHSAVNFGLGRGSPDRSWESTSIHRTEGEEEKKGLTPLAPDSAQFRMARGSATPTMRETCSSGRSPKRSSIAPRAASRRAPTSPVETPSRQ